MIIVDDIMHLRSMRRDIYKVTRRYRVPLIVVHVQTELCISLERNSARGDVARIPADVVRRLHETLDPPAANRGICDRYNCVVDGNTTER